MSANYDCLHLKLKTIIRLQVENCEQDSDLFLKTNPWMGRKYKLPDCLRLDFQFNHYKLHPLSLSSLLPHIEVH
jgi:hypothetical protein